MPRSVFLLWSAWTIGACASAPMRNGPLIDRFARSACVPADRVKNINPPIFLAWDYVVETSCRARIVGEQGSTGYLDVEYPPDPTRHVVAAFGEKSNPVEVRLDPDACRLFVKANGSPAFTDRPPLWLLEYDLLRRKEVQSAKVDPKEFPVGCARTLDPG